MLITDSANSSFSVSSCASLSIKKNNKSITTMICRVDQKTITSWRAFYLYRGNILPVVPCRFFTPDISYIIFRYVVLSINMTMSDVQTQYFFWSGKSCVLTYSWVVSIFPEFFECICNFFNLRIRCTKGREIMRMQYPALVCNNLIFIILRRRQTHSSPYHYENHRKRETH